MKTLVGIAFVLVLSLLFFSYSVDLTIEHETVEEKKEVILNGKQIEIIEEVRVYGNSKGLRSSFLKVNAGAKKVGENVTVGVGQ